jgi:hypothetical protein
VNGLLEEGRSTYHSILRNTPHSSTIYYLITSFANFDKIYNMYVLDQTEFSDHSPISFSMYFNHEMYTSDVNPRVDKLFWNTTETERFNEVLESSKHVFDEITEKLINGESDKKNQHGSMKSAVLRKVTFIIVNGTYH